jgi:hypothetical protein
MTTDSIQGDQGSCPLVNTVPTHEFAFTNNLGRTVVGKTRAGADVVAAAELLPLGYVSFVCTLLSQAL